MKRRQGATPSRLGGRFDFARASNHDPFTVTTYPRASLLSNRANFYPPNLSVCSHLISSRWFEMICACQINPMHITDITSKQTTSTAFFCVSEAGPFSLDMDRSPNTAPDLGYLGILAVRSAPVLKGNRPASVKRRLCQIISMKRNGLARNASFERSLGGRKLCKPSDFRDTGVHFPRTGTPPQQLRNCR
jgi:hypothetical protein